MGLSARVFGFSSFSMLLPQALCTIAAVGAAVRDRAPRCSARRGPARRGGAGAHAGRRSRSAASTTPTRCWCCCWSASAWFTRARGRDRPHQAPRVGGRRRRPRVHDEDAAGLDGRAGARRGLPAGRPAAAARPRPPAARRGRGDGRGQRRVAARRLAVAGLRAVHRRQHGRLGLGPDPRLQRLRPPLRRGEGGGGGASFGGVAGLWRHVQRAGRRPDRVAAAARRRRAGRRPVARRARAARTDVRRAGLVLFGVWALVHVAVFSASRASSTRTT